MNLPSEQREPTWIGRILAVIVRVVFGLGWLCTAAVAVVSHDALLAGLMGPPLIPFTVFAVSGAATIAFAVALWRRVAPGDARLGLIVLGLVMFGLFVWPTAYEYHRRDAVVIRINRLTGSIYLIQPRYIENRPLFGQ